ncbi:hypothetical protein PFISCL1PPCAC_2126, partial [Pristionchus fissidentatus]
SLLNSLPVTRIRKKFSFSMLPLLFVLSLFSPLQSLNCFHSSLQSNTTMNSCAHRRLKWCFSIQNEGSSDQSFIQRGCDEAKICPDLAAVNKFVWKVVKEEEKLSESFSPLTCYSANQRTICCCDRDNCNV